MQIEAQLGERVLSGRMKHPRATLVIALAVGMVTFSATDTRAQEFPDSLWNYFQTPWFNGVFMVAAYLDVTGYGQDQESIDHVGDLSIGREGEIRAIRWGLAGEVNVFGRPIGYQYAAAYRGFDRGFETDEDDSISLFDLAISVPLWEGTRTYIGKQKEPFSHDRVQSLAFNPMPERPAYLDALARSRNIGVLVERWSREARWKWAIGYYNDWLEVGVDESFSKNSQSVIGRVTGLLIDQEADRGRLLHLGGSVNYTDAKSTIGYVRAKPEAFFAPDFVDTGDFPVNSVVNAGLESAFIDGPWSLSAEALRMWTKTPDTSDPGFWGWHVQAAWTITGERRQYDRRRGSIGLLAPDSPTGSGGLGAWQLSARFSHIDATEPGLDGGVMNKYTLALQWFLSPYAFLTLDIGRADLERGGENSETWIGLLRWGIVTL
jgi:phosphate-selective porin OprO/OprP